MAALNGLPTGDILNPGADFSSTVVQTIFPWLQQPSAAVGQTQTIMGNLLSYVSWPAMSLMVIVAITGLIYRVFATARTGDFQVRSNGTMPVRFAIAFLLAMPTPTGFSNGQFMVGTVATWGAGLAANAFQMVMNGIGPNATPIYQPIIPGTETTIAGIVESELCRSLVNYAANNQNLIPEPVAQTGASAGGDGYVTWAYRMSAGNATDAPVCGVVTLHQIAPAGPAVVDLTQQRSAILTGIMAGIQTNVATVAQNYWNTRDPNSLKPLNALIINESNAYTTQLTQAATNATAQLRNDFSVATMRQGSIGQPNGFGAMSAMGWLFAPAWYIEMGRLNGLTLSALTSTPTIAEPTFRGLGTKLSGDLAPLLASSMAYMKEVIAYNATTDRLASPTGYGDLSSVPTPSMDGAGMIERITRSLGFTDSLLRAFLQQLSPVSTAIADPFSSLMGIGQFMVNTALATYGLSIALSSTTGSMAMSVFSALTGDIPGAFGIAAAHMVFQSIGGAVFFAMLTLLIPGLLLNYALPFVPVVVWLFSVVNWLIRFIVMMYGLPFWMMAHLTMTDDSVVGRGLPGWTELAALFLQPVLMIAGLISGYVVFAVSTFLLTVMFYVAAGPVLGGGWLVSNLIGMVVILIIFVLAIISAAVWSFSLITILPEKILGLIGNVQTYMDAHSVGHDAAMIASARALRSTSSGVQGMADQLTKSLSGTKSTAIGAESAAMDRNVQASTSI